MARSTSAGRGTAGAIRRKWRYSIPVYGLFKCLDKQGLSVP